MDRKKIYYLFSLSAVTVISGMLLLSGCAREHKLKPIHFKPVPPPEIPSQELPPVTTVSPVQAIKVANAYFTEAKDALQKGDKKTAQEKYLTARRTLISGGIVPGIFRELNEFWEKEMLPESEKKINFESFNTYKIIDGLKGTPPYSSIDFPFPVPERVLYEIEDAQTRYPDRFQEGLDRSGYYVPHLREALKNAGLPQELCWLAMVESMYKLKAYSSSGAAGMWQFIRSTGEHYNMQINSYIDERYNWVLATSCAIEYLKYLHDFFNKNWELAISGYNMGQGSLLRTIEATGGERNFWKLIETPPANYRIRDETKKYLPRFLAYILICNDPIPYGFSPSPHSPLKWDEIEVQGMYALDALDEAMGYSPGTLSSWNPFLIRGTTPPIGCKLMLPAGDGVKLSSLLNNPSIKQAEIVSHTVKKGETAYHIARKYGVSIDELLKLNGLSSVKSVKTGMELQVPTFGKRHISFAKNEAKTEREQQSEDFHIVKSGETLFSIGKKYGIDVENLATWNDIKGDQRLKVGDKISLKPASNQRIEISQPIAQKEEKVHTKEIFHTVKAGDTLSSIAKKYSTKPEKIMEMNSLSAKSVLRIGQRLIIGKETVKEIKEVEDPEVISLNVTKNNDITDVKSTNKIHEVQKGDTLSKIASLYKISIDELKKWNGLNDDSVLKIGQKLYLHNPEIQEAIKPPIDKPQEKIYIVKQGDTLSKIAKENNVNIKSIMELNNINENSRLQIGQKILLSKGNVSNKTDLSSMSEDDIPEKEDKITTDFTIYRVQSGDSLWSIARKNNVSVDELVRWNNLDASKQLKLGQEIKIYSNIKPVKNYENKEVIQVSKLSNTEENPINQHKEKKQPEVSVYTVQKGDSLYTISKKVGVPLKELMKINNFNETKVLHIGETIHVKK